MKLKKIKPLYTQVITTAYKYEENQHKGKLIDASKMAGSLKEYQEVIAVGDLVRNIKVGDLVAIDPMRYAQKKYQEGSLKDGVITENPVVRYNIPMIELDGKDCLFLQDRDIKFIIEEWDDNPERESDVDLYVPSNKILLN